MKNFVYFVVILTALGFLILNCQETPTSTEAPVSLQGEMTSFDKPSDPVTITYDDVTLPSGGGTFWQPHLWNLNACDLTISYTVDLSGAPNIAYTNNWGQASYVGLFSTTPTWAGALMSGFLYDGQNSTMEFPTYPDYDNTQDLDDKFNMQRFPNPGSYSETMYDVLCGDPPTITPIGSYSNYGIWFDRDGVDPYQDAYSSTPSPGGSSVPWGVVDGGTYNTGGVYDVQLTFQKVSATQGIACALFFSSLVNDDAPHGYGIPTGFDRQTDGSYADFPAGISFETDESKMGQMQVLVQGASGNGSIVVKDLTVTGCLGNIIIDGCDTGVEDQMLPDGSTISDKIAECAANATNHGNFVSCVAHLTNDLKKDGYITGNEKGAIQSCAAQSNLP